VTSMHFSTRSYYYSRLKFSYLLYFGFQYLCILILLTFRDTCRGHASSLYANISK